MTETDTILSKLWLRPARRPVKGVVKGFKGVVKGFKVNMGRQVRENPLHLTPYDYI
jgi:hypothetical protein